jgi:hypothetical protein
VQGGSRGTVPLILDLKNVIIYFAMEIMGKKVVVIYFLEPSRNLIEGMRKKITLL